MIRCKLCKKPISKGRGRDNKTGVCSNCQKNGMVKKLKEKTR